MSKYIYKNEFVNESGGVDVKLLLIHFQDEKEVNFIYSPHLDLTGYGQTLDDAKSSFEIVLEDFVDYTLKKKTLGKVLLDLGWQVKGAKKKPKKVLAPSITTVIGKNKYVADIFDKYQVNTYHENIEIPAFI